MLLSPVYVNNLVGFVVDEAHCVKKWGKQFRKEFSHLGEVRSLLPEGTHVMALTATATWSSRREICLILGLKQPVVVAVLPDRRNITYEVIKTSGIIEETFASLVEEIKRRRTCMDRVIIFCRSYDNAGYIYAYLTNRLGKEAVEPIGAPNLSRFRLVDMFTACTPKNVKETIIKNFTTVDSPLRVVVGTIAFGMGLDCPDVRRVIHWGPPSDLEAYLQETGRAGRDSLSSSAVLYINPNDLRSPFIEESMRNYCQNTSICRRELLLKDFESSNIEECASKIDVPDCCDSICKLLQVFLPH